MIIFMFYIHDQYMPTLKEEHHSLLSLVLIICMYDIYDYTIKRNSFASPTGNDNIYLLRGFF